MWIALVVARATIRNRTHGKTTLFPSCEGSVSMEIGHDFHANPLYCAESIGGKPFFPPCSKGGFALAERGRRFRLVDASGAGRGGDRRPEWGGSSDAGRTLVPRGRGTAGGRTPAAARQGGDQRYDRRPPVARQRWLPQRGVRGRRGQGAAQATAPCRPRTGDQTQTLGNSRKPAAENDTGLDVVVLQVAYPFHSLVSRLVWQLSS